MDNRNYTIIEDIIEKDKEVIKLVLTPDNQNKESNYVQKELAKYLLDTITDLGPCFIKVGQSLSTRPDLVKQSWLDELTKLQDNLPAFNHRLAKEIFKKEMGKSVHEAFEFFPEKDKN